MKRLSLRLLHPVAALILLLVSAVAVAGEPSYNVNSYLYMRELQVPAYQTLREFFDMPDRAGSYVISLTSDSVGPLTFRILRANKRNSSEKEEQVERSYRVGDHKFQTKYLIGKQLDDLIVEMANSNPAAPAKIKIYVIELP